MNHPESAGPSDQNARPTPTPGAPSGRTWDVVVVGGGIGGLAAAGLLAKAGRTVLLLEASAELGGACRGVAEAGHRYELGTSLITGAGPGGGVARLCERLGIDLPAIPCDPTVQLALPRHRLDLTAGPEGWWPEIRREFPDDESGWHELVSDLASLARHRDEMARHLPALPPDGWGDRVRCWCILRMRGVAPTTRRATRQLRWAAETPFRETLQEYGLGPASRQALEACLWYLLIRSSDECSTLEAALALHRLREGAVVLPDGPAILVDLLAQRFQERGGEIRLQTPALRCVAERGRIVGVTTTGETIRARWVVTDVPPDVLMGDLWPTSGAWLRRRPPEPGPWQARSVAQVLGVTIPEAFLPSELGWHCFVVLDSERPARDENVVYIRRTTGRQLSGAGAGLVHLSVGRFVPLSAATDEETIGQALLDALDRVVPGVQGVMVHGWLVPASTLGELWGRPTGTVRYAADSRAWLGRRGLAHRLGWPGLLAVGEWTYPGRLISDVVEGAMHVADLIASAE